MINHLDEQWFGRPNVFNIEEEQSWNLNTENIDFLGRKWKDYVHRSVLEITCGEAPSIVSRYDALTGQLIPIEERIGILDRKLRVVIENTDNEKDWINWAKHAFKSVYEYQGGQSTNGANQPDYDVPGLLQQHMEQRGLQESADGNHEYYHLEFLANGWVEWDGPIRDA